MSEEHLGSETSRRQKLLREQFHAALKKALTSTDEQVSGHLLSA